MKAGKTDVSKKQFEEENAEENLVKRTPVEGVNMDEDKIKTGKENDEKPEEIEEE